MTDRKCLSDMPMDIINNLFEYLKFDEKLVLRKVCRNFRSIVDGEKQKITGTHFKVDTYYARLCVYESSGTFTYNKVSNGCVVGYHDKRREKWKKCRKFLEGENFVDLAMNDLKRFMGTSKLALERFNVDVQTNGFEDFEAFLTKLNKKIHAERADLIVGPLEQSVSILSAMEPKILKSIRISCTQTENVEEQKAEMEKISKMEQWKFATSARLNLMCFIPIDALSHLESFDIRVETINLEDVVKMRNMFHTCPHLKYCLVSTRNEFEIQDVMNVLEPAPGFNIPGTNDPIFYSIRRSLVQFSTSYPLRYHEYFSF